MHNADMQEDNSSRPRSVQQPLDPDASESRPRRRHRRPSMKTKHPSQSRTMPDISLTSPDRAQRSIRFEEDPTSSGLLTQIIVNERAYQSRREHLQTTTPVPTDPITIPPPRMHDIPLPSPPTSPPSSPERPAYSWPMQLPPTHFLVGIESPTLRKQYITAMLESCTPSELAFVSETVTALLKRDFLLQLPAELAYHILSFIDEPKTLTRISQVSKYWYRLSRDESTWRRLCILHGFDNWDEAEQDMQMELERKRKKLMYIGKGKGKEKSVTDEEREKRIARYASSSKLSYRRHFKTSWIIRTNWREGGELLNMHRMPIVQPDTGTVTSLALDAEYVVVGFSNAMVKIFSSVSGVLCKTLVGHDSGVWSVCLFSKGGTREDITNEGKSSSSKDNPKSPKPKKPKTPIGIPVDIHEDLLKTVGGSTEVRPPTDSKVTIKLEKDYTKKVKTVKTVKKDDKRKKRSPSTTKLGEEFLRLNIKAPKETTSMPSIQATATASAGPFSESNDTLVTPNIEHNMEPLSANLSPSTSAAAGSSSRRHRRPTLPTDPPSSASLPSDGKKAKEHKHSSHNHNHTYENHRHRRRSETNDRPEHSHDVQDEHMQHHHNHRSTDRHGRTRQDHGLHVMPEETVHGIIPPAMQLALGLEPIVDSSTSEEETSESSDEQGGQKSEEPPRPTHYQYTSSDEEEEEAETLERTSSFNMTYSTQGWGQPNPIVVSGGCDKVVRVWDVSSGQCIYVLHGHRATIRCMRILKNRPIAITGSRDHDLRVWDVQQGKCLRVLSGHQDRVRCMDVSGNKLVSGSYDNTCRLWNIDTGECLHVLQGHFQQVYSVAFDGVRIVSGAIDTTVRVWDAETGHCIALLQGHTSVVCEVHLSPTLLVTGGADGRVIAFSLSNYQAVNQIAAHDSSVTSLQFDDEFLVTGGNDGRVKLYETRTGNFVRELSDRSQSVWKVAFVRGLYAVMCMRGGKTVVEIWSLRPRSKKSQRRLQRARQAAE
ncbi:hypothetical protein D9613_007272 [Agrocybe pediades]|uniref:F-box domain-containing protein n=1 Tax=Agrocybe pediades TaxID=84607 RepID=A0A8H4QGX4_9AGAR|nr:hypothetical protein D9613_007272 [Agrocybe pediades]